MNKDNGGGEVNVEGLGRAGESNGGKMGTTVIEQQFKKKKNFKEASWRKNCELRAVCPGCCQKNKPSHSHLRRVRWEPQEAGLWKEGKKLTTKHLFHGRHLRSQFLIDSSKPVVLNILRRGGRAGGSHTLLRISWKLWILFPIGYINLHTSTGGESQG